MTGRAIPTREAKCVICALPIDDGSRERPPVPWTGGMAHFECATAEEEYDEWNQADRPGDDRE